MKKIFSIIITSAFIIVGAIGVLDVKDQIAIVQRVHGQIPEHYENTLSIPSSKGYLDANGDYHVVGEVFNNSPASNNTASSVQVSGTFYDSDGKVIAADYTFTMPTDIEAGQKAPFHMIVLDSGQDLSLIQNYTVQASSNN